MPPALETEALTKCFRGGAPVVDRVTLTVPRGAIYGFLGANGAGKTTTLRLVLGLLRPSGGAIRLFGEPLSAQSLRGVGALIEASSGYPNLTGRENLEITRLLLRLPRTEIDRALALVDLTRAANQRVGTYSLGMKQRLSIARALLGRPRLLILDEPTNGLDPNGITDMRDLLRRLPAEGDVTLIVSSHLLGEIEQVATHVGLLHRGRLLVEAPLGALVGGDDAVEVATRDRARAAVILGEAGLDVAPDTARGVLLVRPGAAAPDAAAIAALLVGRGQALQHLTRHRPSLEAVYQREIARAA